MKFLGLSFCIIILLFMGCTFENPNRTTVFSSYDAYPVYDGPDLGLTYAPASSTFRVWAPTAEQVTLRLFEKGAGGLPVQTNEMLPAENGTWLATIEGDLVGKFYTFQAKINAAWLQETADPYAKATGVNGIRAQIVDLDQTDPEGWENDTKPAFVSKTDAIIYELHIRDLSIHPQSGIQQKGKFLGLAEAGTKGPGGVSTGLDHIKELGVTHVHLLPCFDFLSVDETRLDSTQFNWGYDPQHYNVPEGSYSSNPFDGQVRIREFKHLVKTLHENGLRVIMDVAYNHTGATENSVFNQLVPGYYYRQHTDGSFSNASACGNETASERTMMRKFMLESVKYWAEEYHIDGFRFDLMGIHDIETMNQVSEVLHKVDSNILLYGEGWTAGSSPLPDSLRALKLQTYQLNKIAAFSDDFRDGLKGHVFTATDAGFVSGKPDQQENIKFGIAASLQHPQIAYDKVTYSKGPWATEPHHTINYVSCHDNHTLWDRLELSAPKVSIQERIHMHQLALAAVLTSQGISFLHAGSEFLRTKNGEENTFRSPDSINQLDWARKLQYRKVFDYAKSLIALRKAHPALRMTTAEMVRTHLQFLETGSTHVVAFRLTDHANGDTWSEIVVVLNSSKERAEVKVDTGAWKIGLEPYSGAARISGGKISVGGIAGVIVYMD